MLDSEDDEEPDQEITDATVHRLWISDEEWARTHPSWKALRPHKVFSECRSTDETDREYAARIGAEFGFPEEVLAQWINPHYFNQNTVNNYAWIDFTTVEFTKERWTTERLCALRVIDDYRDFVEERAAMFTSIKDFFPTKRDREHWWSLGSWRVPPVLIDIEGLGPIPHHSDIVGRFQLVEGHSRIGYLRAFARIGDSAEGQLAREHEVYILRVRT
jgi:hypothetical protein